MENVNFQDVYAIYYEDYDSWPYQMYMWIRLQLHNTLDRCRSLLATVFFFLYSDLVIFFAKESTRTWRTTVCTSIYLPSIRDAT